MTEGVKALFKAMPEGKADDLIFRDRKGKRLFRYRLPLTELLLNLDLIAVSLIRVTK